MPLLSYRCKCKQNATIRSFDPHLQATCQKCTTPFKMMPADMDWLAKNTKTKPQNIYEYLQSLMRPSAPREKRIITW